MADDPEAGPIKVQTSCGKPQVWVRIRPAVSYENSFIAIGNDGKTLHMNTNVEDRSNLQNIYRNNSLARYTERKPTNNILTFATDGILDNASQEEVYESVVQGVVRNALIGISGVIVCLGPEGAGKSLTLFGKTGKFPYRGVISRALEDIFEVRRDRANEIAYFVQIGVVEVRRNRIRDLLTIGGIADPGNQCGGPQAYHYEPCTSVESALVLLMMALAAQKNTPREDIALFHTIVYLDIYGQSLLENNKSSFRSRITFAKIASIPKRSSELDHPSPKTCNLVDEFCGITTCTPLSRKGSRNTNMLSPRKTMSSTCHCALNSSKYAISPVTEAIEIRKDLFLLEQMFERANEAKKSSGSTTPRAKPKICNSQYFRQCKLAFCLQDIITSPNSELRIILNIRPEKCYMQRTLEAMRFAKKAESSIGQECIIFGKTSGGAESITSQANQPNPEMLKQELASIYGEIESLRREHEQKHDENGNKDKKIKISDLYNQEKLDDKELNPTRAILLQTAAYLDGKINDIEIANKHQSKILLETVRQIWQYAIENEWEEKQLVKIPSLSHQTTQTTEETLARRKKSKSSSTSLTASPSKQGVARKGRKPSLAKLPSGSHETGDAVTGSFEKVGDEVKSIKRGSLAQTESIDAIAGADPASQPSNDINDEASALLPRNGFTTENHENDASVGKSSSGSNLSQINPIQEAWKDFLQIPEAVKSAKLYNRLFLSHKECSRTLPMLPGLCEILQRDIHSIASLLLYGNGSGLQSDESAIVASEEILPADNKIDQLSEEQMTDPMIELSVLNAHCDEFFDKMMKLIEAAFEKHEQLLKQSKSKCEELFMEFSKGASKELNMEGFMETIGTLEDLCFEGDLTSAGVSCNPSSLKHIEDLLKITQNPDGQEATMSAASEQDDTANNTRMIAESLLIAKNYEEISKSARRHAKQLMKYHSRRPSWVSSFSKLNC